MRPLRRRCRQYSIQASGLERSAANARPASCSDSGRSLARRGDRKELQIVSGYGRYARGRDSISGKRVSGLRIEQRETEPAEIAAQLGRRGQPRNRLRRADELAAPLIIREEESAVSAAVDLRYPDRPAEIASALLALERAAKIVVASSRLVGWRVLVEEARG